MYWINFERRKLDKILYVVYYNDVPLYLQNSLSPSPSDTQVWYEIPSIEKGIFP
jgi:hypothetical protein